MNRLDTPPLKTANINRYLSITCALFMGTGPVYYPRAWQTQALYTLRIYGESPDVVTVVLPDGRVTQLTSTIRQSDYVQATAHKSMSAVVRVAQFLKETSGGICHATKRKHLHLRVGGRPAVQQRRQRMSQEPRMWWLWLRVTV
jgi:hypothetical protein